MSEIIALSPDVSLGIIAFLLSLLPAGLFTWLWYLRRRDRSVPAQAVAIAFFAGLGLVIPAFGFEDFAAQTWLALSPATAHYFAGAVLPLVSLVDIVLPALATFGIVATIEEGLRYVVLRWWIKQSRTIDQVFDGLVVGVALGIGFATLENTFYFLSLFQQGSFDTLVFVFFLRFLISTLAHISFGGLMGALIAQGVFHLYQPKKFYWQAFLLPWFLHGLYDLLLGVDLSFYAVLLLLPGLLVLVQWTKRGDFFSIHRKNGRLLAAEEAPQDERLGQARRSRQFNSPWNVNAPWLRGGQTRRGLSRDG